jgi:hypothetical protein
MEQRVVGTMRGVEYSIAAFIGSAAYWSNLRLYGREQHIDTTYQEQRISNLGFIGLLLFIERNNNK